jgi:hypothetical protein
VPVSEAAFAFRITSFANEESRAHGRAPCRGVSGSRAKNASALYAGALLGDPRPTRRAARRAWALGAAVAERSRAMVTPQEPLAIIEPIPDDAIAVAARRPEMDPFEAMRARWPAATRLASRGTGA